MTHSGLAVANDRALIIVAHPDDESFSMGGTLAQLSCQIPTHVVALSDGVSSRFTTQSDACIQARLHRAAHFRSACHMLGAEGQHLSVFLDQQADTVPQLDINRAVAHCVEQIHPCTIYTHHVGDLNRDHRRVAEAVFVACRGPAVSLFSMAPEWPHLCVGPAWHPNIREVLSNANRERKWAACACYVDELRPAPHPRSEEVVRATAEEWFLKVQ